MTLDGWTLVKQICAGLIPGVNLKTRPRAKTLFIQHEVNERRFAIGVAIMPVSDDPQKVYDALYECGMPFASPSAIAEAEKKQLIAVYEKMKSRKKDKQK